MSPLRLLALNLTRRCNLHCAHCYLDAGSRHSPRTDELATEEIEALLAEIAGRSNETLVVLSGGEPLLRSDLERIVHYGARLGLSVVIGSNGTLLDDARVRALKAAGLLGAGISVDSLDPDHHDRFRGLEGSWEKTMAGIDACRRHQLSFQLHFSVTDANADELPAMIDFARSAGARVLNVFFLVCTGRGESMTDISAARYEQVLRDLVRAQERYTDLILRARCAPQFKRVAHTLAPNSPLNRISGRDGDGCIAGIQYCRVTPEGDVTACPYIAVPEGNIREQPFLAIWDHAPGFQRLRAPVLHGKCGACEYQALCGGCRARGLAHDGDLMAPDPFCGYLPQGGATIVPLREQEAGGIGWSDAALQRLSRMPGFLRGLVRQRAEAYVVERGETTVTAEHLSVLAARRFGAGGPPGRPERPIG